MLTGLFGVNMWGFIGFTSFVDPQSGLGQSFWGYLIASVAALVGAFVCTYFFGFSDRVLNAERKVKKIRLGRREPAGA